jgi:methionyl-tRNA synthetase
MSKSRGNIVRTETILDAFGTLKSKPVDAPGPELSDEYWKHEQDLFASDVLRYFLLREIPFGQDGSFSFDALLQRYNSDLANGYGNLVSRTLAMIGRYFDHAIPDPNDDSVPLIRVRSEYYLSLFADVRDEDSRDFEELLHSAKFEDLEFSMTLQSASRLITLTDVFLTKQAPWKARDGEAQDSLVQRRKAVLYGAAEDIRIVTALLHPVLPYATRQVWAQLGLGDIEVAAKNGELKNLEWGGLKPGTKLGELGPIFPRAPKELIQIMTDMENPATPVPSKLVDEKIAHAAPVPEDPTHPGAPPRTSAMNEPNPGAQVGASAAVSTERPGTPSHSEAPASGVFATSAAGSSIPDTPQIAIDDFVKIDLRVAQIIVAERIPKADKLLRLEVDLGYEKRQILSGIAEWYTPEELIGRRIVVIANLAPRKMRGLESHGMLLAASAGEDGKPVLATFGEEIALGSRLK